MGTVAIPSVPTEQRRGDNRGMEVPDDRPVPMWMDTVLLVRNHVVKFSMHVWDPILLGMDRHDIESAIHRQIMEGLPLVAVPHVTTLRLDCSSVGCQHQPPTRLL